MQKQMKKILSVILTAVILIGSFSISGIAKSASKTPSKVTGVTATAGYNTVKLRWKKSADATSYRIYRYSEAKQRYVRVTETKSTTYYVKGLSVHKTYKFYVKAVNSTKSKTLVGKRSDIVTAKTKYTPSAVKNLKASTVKSSSVTLTWDKSPNVTQYRVYRYNSKTNKYEQVGKTTSNKYTVKGLKANKEYRFKVRVYLKVNEKSYLSEAAMIKVKTKKQENASIISILKEYYFENSIQTNNIYEFSENGKLIEYFSEYSDYSIEDLEYSETYNYSLNNDTLTIYWGGGYTTKLKYVHKNKAIYYRNYNLDISPNSDYLFYETGWVDNGAPIDQPMYLARGKKKSDLKQKTISEEEAVEIAVKYFKNTYGMNAIGTATEKTLYGKKYYYVAIKTKIENHWSTQTFVYVSTDGKQVFEE